jgi:hypothetical protein
MSSVSFDTHQCFCKLRASGTPDALTAVLDLQ